MMRMTSKDRPQSSGRRVVALVAAAGSGTRLGAEVPKAYVQLRGRTLLERSVTAMINAEVVDHIIVLISPDMEDYADRILARAGLRDQVHLVHGGGERADSVWAGLQAITGDTCPDVDEDNAVVLIHDCARALTPPGMIARVAHTVLAGAPAAIPVVPVADTIKTVRPAGTGEQAYEEVVATPDRSHLRAVQTPQGFDLATLIAANKAYYEQKPDFVATDDASLMEWFGTPVRTVQGDPMAFKVTTPIDMTLATAITDEAEPTIFEVPDSRS
ncbi:2-C-methyl-D-erythritol 4-phosphate cytidylyltransferase [Corynebacterium renale]|nr:2-C-methyl-D-erythritol 4-phosphate cytidylyltransferase [Corynebacterium renale]